MFEPESVFNLLNQTSIRSLTVLENYMRQCRIAITPGLTLFGLASGACIRNIIRRHPEEGRGD